PGPAGPGPALVRRSSGVRDGLDGADARARRIGRITARLVLVALAAPLILVVVIMGNLEMTSTSDGLINAVRLFSTVVLPLGALAALWYAWQALRSPRRRIWAKLWAILLALACLFALWFGFAYH